tara:strand:- start:401 stop:1789 length:1389 start_codon:yes stop_codon:yes gene_type:complete
MDFNSINFLFYFLPCLFIIFYILKKNYKLTIIILLLASLIFYYFSNYLPLLIFSITVNFLAAYFIQKINIYILRKILLTSGILFNITILFYYKYLNFILSNLSYIFNFNFIETSNYLLPLGISFFSLQQIAFLIDTYFDKKEKINFINYSLFVSFFPQLIAGPIVRYNYFIKQLNQIRIDKLNLISGLQLISIGLFKKIIIADSLAMYINNNFSNIELLSSNETFFTTVAFTMQIYFDFSGYTDIALGLALLFSIKLPINFMYPYLSMGMIDFWKRWHISLSNFINDYIFTSINRSFKNITHFKIMLSIFITMLIAGLWHGASWLFVIFGGLHGIGIVTNHYFRKFKLRINKLLSWFVTFNFINLTFIFFRAEDFNQIKLIFSNMFKIDLIYFEFIALMPILIFSFIFIFYEKVFLEKNKIIFLTIDLKPIIYFIILIISVLHLLFLEFNYNIEKQFIYFNF